MSVRKSAPWKRAELIAQKSIYLTTDHRLSLEINDS